MELDLITFIQSTFLGILFITYKKGIRQANIFLALFLLTENFNSLLSYFYSSGLALTHHLLLQFPTFFLFLSGPLLFLYVKALLAEEQIQWRKYQIIFLPAVIELVINLFLAFLSFDAKMKLANNENFALAHHIFSLTASIYNLLFIGYSIRQVKSVRVKELHFKVEYLYWLLGYWLVRVSFWFLYFFCVLTLDGIIDPVLYTSEIISFLSFVDFM
ncbi:hypothetical protein [Chryseosolibacter indicus]|uniref:Uncharacterized protein n=1 Tax=Chryseosolibacter indicus TaxID=2782351 RepID=A0ABS5VPW7_9BACT|nr:hypothetical protein [Chryseosolibacter indicus]MBT1703386.1 hypothetical protein [Chryseosolibacter indicus]